MAHAAALAAIRRNQGQERSEPCAGAGCILDPIPIPIRIRIRISVGDVPDPKNPHMRPLIQARRPAPALPTSAPAKYVRHTVTGKD